MNAMIWLDMRGAEYVKKRVSGLLSIEGYDVFKLQRSLRITGGMPLLHGKDPIGHTLYIQSERPEIYRQAYKLLDVIDYVDFRLTGRFITTIDTKSFWWVVDIRDLANAVYHDGMIKEWGLDRDKLPELRRCTDVVGTLKPDVADELGLGHDVQVIAGGYDLPVAAVGSGAVEDYSASLSISTSSFLTVHVPFKKVDIFHIMASLPGAIPNRYFLVSEQETAGGNLIFFRDKLLYHKDALLEVEPPSRYFEAVNEVAESVPPGSNGLIYTPWIYGEFSPVSDPWIRGGIHNLSLGNTRGDLVRAIMEGVAYNTRWVLGPMEKFCGRTLNPINIAGGGANSALWCQIHADVLNRVIRRVKAPIQAVARGAAFIASVGLGLIRFEDIPRLIEFQGEYHPNPDNRKLYDDLFAEYVNLYKQNKRIYERLNRGRVKEH
jgi:xylulokinase